jgi:hypothetical protein
MVSVTIFLTACAALAAPLVACAQDGASEKQLETEIVSATVYARQAQIVRSGEIDVSPGSVKLVCDDLPEKLIETSLSVDAAGVSGVRILGIDLRRKEKPEIDSPRHKELAAELEAVESELERLRARRDALNRRQEIARSIGQFSSDLGQEQLAVGDFQPTYWQSVLTFFEKENVETEDRLAEIGREIGEVSERRSWLRSELSAMQIGEGPDKEVVIDCEASSSGRLSVELTYLVPDASWSPEYTVRYLESDAVVELTYSARIGQATGEDWKGVSVVLSTATPHVGAAPPELLPMFVGGTTGTIRGRVTDAATGKALPYANVFVVGTSYGAITKPDGTYVISEIPAGEYLLQVRYMGYKTDRRSGVRVSVAQVERVDFALDAEELAAEEVVIEASRPISAADEVIATQPGVVLTEGELHARGGRAREVKEHVAPAVPHVEAELLRSAFTANLVIPRPVDLATGAEPSRALVVRERLPGSFVREAVPRLSDYVYVRGSLSNPLEIPLLPGPAQVYVETVPEGSNTRVSDFVGQDRIDAVAPGESFSMYLGIDQNVKVEHVLARKEVLSKASDRNAKVRYQYVITAESFRPGRTELRIADRIPVSTIREVEIDDVEIVPEPDERTDEGLVDWEMEMGAGERREISMTYVVEYPSQMSPVSLGLEE